MLYDFLNFSEKMSMIIMKSSIIFLFLWFMFVNAYADGTHPIGIRLDGTVGNAGKIGLTGPDYDIKAELGKQVGPNLLHSFEQFNIHAGEIQKAFVN